MSDVRRVLVIYTGGTIGMVTSAQGYVPEPGALERQLRTLRRFHDPSAPDGDWLRLPASPLGPGAWYRVLEHTPLLDSSNVGADEWVQIAREIEAHYTECDAFVVLHGTDTMAYTASALSFMLENLQRTVVLTGSQVPLSHLRSDAVDNLLGALILAAHYEIPEVTLYFRDKLFRGNRTRKVDAAGFDAFASGNLPPLAEIGVGIDVAWERVRTPGPGPLRVRPITRPQVAALRFYPGMNLDLFDRLLRPPLQGLVLETFGSGNAPDREQQLHHLLRRAHDEGIVVVNVTQCLRGSVTPDYAAGRALHDAGVVSGHDLTAEAALTKLSWLLSQRNRPDEVRRLMGTDLRGELTLPDAPRYGRRAPRTGDR